MKTIAGTLNAYVTEHNQEPYALAIQALKDGGRNEKSVIDLLALSPFDMTAHGWTKIGTAEIAVTFDDDDTVRENLVASLKAKKAEVLATAQAEATRIEERIQSILAIEWDGGNS